MTDFENVQMTDTFLPPAIGPDEAPFWEATKQGELRIQQCASCDKLRHPPRPMCPWCNSVEHRWAKMSGQGTIYSYVVPHPPLLKQFHDVAPFNVILVTLDEDPAIRLVGNLVTKAGDPINAVDPSTVEIGTQVKVVFDPVAEEIHMPRWVKA